MADEGASPSELVIEACRRNNTDLLQEVINTTNPTTTTETQEDAVAALLNNTRDGMGNAALHIAASSGSYEILDLLLDQPGLETDPLDRLNQETPLHKAVALCNTFPAPSSTSNRTSQPTSNTTSTTTQPPDPSSPNSIQTFLSLNPGHAIIEILLDAGCDPRIRNQSKMKAVELVDGRNAALGDFLRRAEFALVEGEGDVIGVDDGDGIAGGGEASDGPSDSE